MVRTFGDFELDDSLRKLSRGGQRVKLTGQALDLLCLLVERSGELITREEIKRELWPDSNVEFEHSLDVLVNRLRSVLGDSGKTPRYIETVPRKGYRFLEPVTCEHDRTNGTARQKWTRRLGTYAAIAILAAIAALMIVRTRYEKFVPRHRSSMSPTANAR
jgi:DNA-binding winged helix-turn-helix (wHTH) protein